MISIRNMLTVAIPLKKYQDPEPLLRTLEGIKNVILLDSGSSTETLTKIRSLGLELGIEISFYRSNFEHNTQYKNNLLKICDKLDYKYYMILDTNHRVSNMSNLLSFIEYNPADCYLTSIESTSVEGILQEKSITIIKKNHFEYEGTVYPEIKPKLRNGLSRVEVPRDECFIADKKEDKSDKQLNEEKAIIFDNEERSLGMVKIFTELEDWENVINYANALDTEDDEELYFTYMMQAHAMIQLEIRWEDIIIILLKAWNIFNTIEPLIYIAKYYIQFSKYEHAYTWLRTICDTPYPNKLTRFIKRSDYVYERWRLMQTIGIQLKKFQDAYNANKHLLKLRTSERMSNFYNSLIIREILKDNYKNRNTKKTIVFYGGETDYEWYGNMKNNISLRRKEVSIINLAEEFVKRDYHCVIFSNTVYSQTVNNVEYLPLTDYDSFCETYMIDKLIIVDDTNKVKYNINVNSVYIWLQSELPIGNLEWNEKVKAIIVLTKWHKNRLLSVLSPDYHYLIKTISNGINIKRFIRKKIKRVPRRFIFTGDVSDGLDYLLKVFPKIREKYNDATLHIYSNVTNQKTLDYINIFDYIHLQERVDQGVLSNKILESDYWLYLPDKESPCCMSGYEMQSGKVFCITTKIGSLENIIGDRGLYVERNEESILNAIYQIESDSMLKKEKIRDGFEWSAEQTWSNVGDVWLSIFNKDQKEDSVVEMDIEIHMNPLKFTVLKRDLLFMKYMLYENCWEYDICEVIKEQLDSNATFIEIGSYVGFHTILGAMCCKNVYTYEIDTELTDVIKRNVENNNIDNVKIHCTGIGNERKVLGVWKHEYNGRTTFHPELKRSLLVESQYMKTGQSVKCETLDYLYKNRRNEFNKIVLKVNANCKNVLLGAKHFMDIFKPVIIIKQSNDVEKILLKSKYKLEKVGNYFVATH